MNCRYDNGCVSVAQHYYVGRSNLNENLVPLRAKINLYECACADKL
jgi:hypothetical protein